MSEYTATAVREGRWWVVEVAGIGTSQGRTTGEAERMAADLIAIMRDVPVEDVKVHVEFKLGGALANEVRDVKQAQKQAETAQKQAAEKSRSAVRHVLAAGLSKQDAARVLGISAQRVSQLAPSSRGQTPTARKQAPAARSKHAR